jgi:CHASE2 domain-containing sensor protein
MIFRSHIKFRQAVIYIASGLAITAVLVFAKDFVERTALGRRLEQYTYTLLLNALPKFVSEGQSVVVVDISQFTGGKLDTSTGRLVPTSRAKLKEVLDVLEAIQPQAIAIDVDFSPDRRGWIDSNDERFFEFCLRLHSKIPVTLGVFRTLREPKNAWLGLPKFAPMAGSLYLPAGGLERVPVWVKDPNLTDRLPSIGDRLASSWYLVHTDRFEHLQPWIHRFSERLASSPVRREGLLIGEVLTNHAGVNQLISETIRFTEAKELLRHTEQLRGRMVMLGAVDQATDLYLIPGQEVPRPGVFVHASGAYTLASEPIYEFSHGARLLLDFAISLLVLLAIVVSRRRRIGHERATLVLAEDRTPYFAVGLILVAGFAFVWVARVMWLDFLLVALSLLIHSAIEKRLHRHAH